MADNRTRIQNELRRLANGPAEGEKLGGLGSVRFVAPCPFGAMEVLTKVKNVLVIVDQATLSGWPSRTKWLELLPQWFTSACAPEESREEADRWLAWWRKLPPEEQSRAQRELAWSLDNWLYWFKPENRQWYWWDAKALDDIDHVIVAIEVDGWPFPWSNLRWLFRAAGASDLTAEE